MASYSYAYFSGYYNDEPHFLESCFLCHKPLHNGDIFMYRGNTPFCSQECRQEKIEIDEASERKWKKRSSSSNKVRSKHTELSTTDSETNKSVRTGTVAVS